MSDDQSKGDPTKSGQYRKTGRSSSFNQQRHPFGGFKVDASSSFPLQFGSISPGFMNGMQIPARTSSVLEILDEQEENKACHESADLSGTSMQMQFHQPQFRAQFGVPHPQTQSQAMPTSSLPITIQMEMSIPLPLGNPPMFVSGLQPTQAVQSQGLMHQGQSLNYSFQLGHQMPPQLGGTGINMASEFPPQQAAKFMASSKTVKITHPGTHEGLQRNNSDPDQCQCGTAFEKGLLPSPQTPLQVMHKAKKKHGIERSPDEEEIKQRQLKVILNKLTSQNFEKMFEQVKQVNIDNVVTLSGLVSQIFDKALMKPAFCEIYADLCFHLAAELPDFSTENERITFKRLLLNKCQEEFERGEKEEEEEETNKADEEGPAKHSEEKREAKRLRRRMLGNIRLIGELYKKRMLTEKIMHDCIRKLLGQHHNPDEENVEALCILMGTIGEIIDHPRAKEQTDAYFDMMSQLSNNMKLSSRVRFMLKKSINLRKNKWQQRRKVEGPKKIDEVHRDAAELGPQEGQQRNNSESDRWQRENAFLKGLTPSPQTPLHVMHKAENKYVIGKFSDEEEIKQRRLKAILNKLTSENVEKMFEQVKQVNIDNVVTLSGLISQIFDKALTKPTFCEIYANLCFHLAAELPDFSIENERITFKRLILNKCQIEFERGEREEEEANKADEEEGGAKQSEEEREKKRLQARRRMLGNIRLIGELYKKRMLTERIMHECIKKLLGQCQNPDEEDVEALCILMSTIGEIIDHPKAKEHMDAYFDIMGQLSNNMKLSSGLRFMLKDSIDLRKNKWQQRRKVGGQEKIDQVHRDAAELGPQGGRQRNNSDPDEWQHGTAFQKGLMPSSRTSLRVMHKAENKCEISKFSDQVEIKQRQLKAILNKLTYQNFEKMFEQVKRVNIDNAVTLCGLISLIFDKALMKPTFCEIYAKLCFHLAAELPDLSVENERITFKRLILNRCQVEFERGEKEEEEANKADEEGRGKQSEEEREEKRLRARRRMLGNMRLIGELYKNRMLTERIMHECIKKLLGQYQNTDEEDVEALCILMSTIGETIDHPKAKEHMDAYFDIMAQLSNNMKLSSGLRFMLKATIDLRKNKWQQRKVEGPQNIDDEVHRTDSLWSKRDLMPESSSSPSVHNQSNPQE